MNDNANNGLLTKIWGPAMWKGLHCIAFGYPIEPTIEQQEEYKLFFRTIPPDQDIYPPVQTLRIFCLNFN